MVLFNRMSFSEIIQKLSESTLELGMSSLSSFDFDFENGSNFSFEKDYLVESHVGTMTLYKKNGKSKSFQMKRETFYFLSRAQLERMQPTYEVLKIEGYADVIWKMYEQHLTVEKSMRELINKFQEELLIIKEKNECEFLFTYDDLIHTEMAKFMLFGEGGIERDVHTTLSNKYI